MYYLDVIKYFRTIGLNTLFFERQLIWRSRVSSSLINSAMPPLISLINLRDLEGIGSSDAVLIDTSVFDNN